MGSKHNYTTLQPGWGCKSHLERLYEDLSCGELSHSTLFCLYLNQWWHLDWDPLRCPHWVIDPKEWSFAITIYVKVHILLIYTTYWTNTPLSLCDHFIPCIITDRLIGWKFILMWWRLHKKNLTRAQRPFNIVQRHFSYLHSPSVPCPASPPLTNMHTAASLRISWCQGMSNLLTPAWILLSAWALGQSKRLHIKQFSPFSTLEWNSWSDCKAGHVRPTQQQAANCTLRRPTHDISYVPEVRSDPGWLQTRRALQALSTGWLINERPLSLLALSESNWCSNDQICAYMPYHFWHMLAPISDLQFFLWPQKSVLRTICFSSLFPFPR